MRNIRHRALVLLRHFVQVFEDFAAELLGSFTDALWHACQNERPPWSEAFRWLQGLCGGCATPWPRSLLHRLTVRRCKWCREAA